MKFIVGGWEAKDLVNYSKYHSEWVAAEKEDHLETLKENYPSAETIEVKSLKSGNDVKYWTVDYDLDAIISLSLRTGLPVVIAAHDNDFPELPSIEAYDGDFTG